LSVISFLLVGMSVIQIYMN